MKRAAIATAAIFVFGAARLPFERHLDAIQTAAGFRTTRLDLSMREQLGQMGFVASLSGFRSLMAAYLFIEAYEAWTTPIDGRPQWTRMASLLKTVTTLQPKSELYWDMAAWHMAWNASASALDDKRQPSEILRRREARKYWDLGKSFLEDGIANNPKSLKLWMTLAELYRQKYEDHCKAAEAYAGAARLPEAPPFVKRFAAFELAQCEGHEKEAYEELLKLYILGKSERTTGLIANIKRLEEKLGIPADKRIKDTDVR